MEQLKSKSKQSTRFHFSKFLLEKKRWCVKEGTQALSEEMAKVVKSNPKCDVLLDNPVVSITSSKGVVEVKSRKLTVRAKYCVSAIPINLQSSIRWEPALPVERDQLIQRMPMGSAIKVFVYYKTHFWRKKGFSGFVLSLNQPVIIIFDASREGEDFPALVCFLNGAPARKWALLSEEKRKQDIIDQLVTIFGEEARDCNNYVEKNWVAEQYSKGKNSSFFSNSLNILFVEIKDASSVFLLSPR